MAKKLLKCLQYGTVLIKPVVCNILYRGLQHLNLLFQTHGTSFKALFQMKNCFR
jgi:hypothetical protein